MLTADVITLRSIERGDLAQLLAWRNAPGLRQYFRERRDLTMEDQLCWHERVVENNSSDPIQKASMLMFAIEQHLTGELLGACGLCYIDWINGSAEVSIYIGAQLVYIDELHAPTACRELIDYAFDELDLRRLWVEVYAYDTRKARLFESLGFSLEGRLREHRLHEGDHHDSLLFGLLRSERRP